MQSFHIRRSRTTFKKLVDEKKDGHEFFGLASFVSSPWMVKIQEREKQ